MRSAAVVVDLSWCGTSPVIVGKVMLIVLMLLPAGFSVHHTMHDDYYGELEILRVVISE